MAAHANTQRVSLVPGSLPALGLTFNDPLSHSISHFPASGARQQKVSTEGILMQHYIFVIFVPTHLHKVYGCSAGLVVTTGYLCTKLYQQLAHCSSAENSKAPR